MELTWSASEKGYGFMPEFQLDGIPIDEGDEIVTDGEGEYYHADACAYYDMAEGEGLLPDGTHVHRVNLIDAGQ
jgi:hypothetical protein